MSESNNGFLPANYEQPPSGGRYTKLEDGDNRLRIISNSIQGWIGWQEKPTGNKEPLRVEMDRKEDLTNFNVKEIKHFWAFMVWNYQTKTLEIFEVTQRSIQDAIMNLYQSADWGDPKGYDIIINRTGQKLETKYNVQGGRQSQLDGKLVLSEYEKAPCAIEKLFQGKDPWDLSDLEKETCLASFKETFNDLPF